MPTITLNDVQNAIIDRVEAAAGTGILPVKLQDKDLDGVTGPFAELIISPFPTGVDTSTSVLLRGFIEIKVYVEKNNGTVYPADEGQKFLDLFPFDGDNFGPSNAISIVRPGAIMGPVSASESGDRAGWRYTPALIEYEVQSCSTN